MSKTIISFPKLGDYNIPLNFLFKHTTNCKIINSPEITKKTIELGSKYSPSDACLPFKYTLGNFIESLDMGANVLIQAGGGCRYRYYGEVQEQILKDLGYNFDLYQLSNSDKRSIKEIYEFLPYVHMCLVMTVEPGKGGQTLLTDMVNKIAELKEYIQKNNLEVDIEADGGINLTTAEAVKKAGANILVSGTAILMAKDYKVIIDDLRA